MGSFVHFFVSTVLQDLVRFYLQAVNIAPGDQERDKNENSENEPENPLELGALFGSGESRDDESQANQAVED
jgi:hypothetical protein